MKNLKNQLIRLGNTNPELRKDLKPVLDYISSSQNSRMSSREGSDFITAKAKLLDAMHIYQQKTENLVDAASPLAAEFPLEYHADLVIVEKELEQLLKEVKRHRNSTKKR